MWHDGSGMVRVRRIYAAREAEDGFRVLVDRLWPRGVSKANAGVDLWLKEIAPSTKLRTWFAHDPSKWAEFQLLYREELERNPEPVAQLRERVRQGAVTLLYSARDVEHNHAPVLLDFLVARR